MTNYVIRFFNIIIAAILAGASFGIRIGFNPMGLSLSAYGEAGMDLFPGYMVVVSYFKNDC